MSTPAPFLSSDQAQTLTSANTIVAGLSILGCLFNLITTLMIRNTWTTLGWMIIALSLSDILTAVMTILLRFENTSYILCQCISFLTTFGNINSFIWTCCFGHALLASMRQTEDVRSLKRYWKAYTSIALSVSAFLGTVAVFTEFYTVGVDPAPNYCLHRTKHEEFDIGSLLVLLLPSLLSAVYCICCYLAAIKDIRKSGSRIYSELLLFPLILIVCNSPICVVGIMEQLKLNIEIPFKVMLISNILWNLQGFLNAFAYGLSQKIIFGYQEICCKRKGKQDRSTLYQSIDYTSEKLSAEDSSSSNKVSFYNDSKSSLVEIARN